MSDEPRTRAEFDRIIEETRKFTAEQHKLMREAEKFRAEEMKLWRDWRFCSVGDRCIAHRGHHRRPDRPNTLKMRSATLPTDLSEFEPPAMVVVIPSEEAEAWEAA